MSKVEEELENGKYAVAVFGDVKGTFSHTSSQIICEATSREVLRSIVNWMMDLLGIFYSRKLSVFGDCKELTLYSAC